LAGWVCSLGCIVMVLESYQRRVGAPLMPA